MAYMSQENKKALAPGIKEVLKKYSMTGSIRVRHHSTLIVTLKSGELFQTLPNGRDHLELSAHYSHDKFSDKEGAFLKELSRAMQKGNHDNSDIMTDYCDVGWYSMIHIGSWGQPYKHLAKVA